MKKRRLPYFFLLLFLASAGAGKSQSLVRSAAWAGRAGADLNFPLIRNYNDFSAVKGADYFWQYSVDPKIGLGYYAEVFSVKPLRSRRHAGFVSYGIGYRQVVRKVEYSGWEGGGISGIYNQGSGTKQWSDHSVTFSGSITHQFFAGLRRKIILNSLGFSAAFNAYEQERFDFTGKSTYTDGTVVLDALSYDRGKLSRDFYIPQVHLNYELGYVVPAGKNVIIPHLCVPILRLNNYLQKYEPRTSPLKMRREYYKEVRIGVTFMRAGLK